MKEPYFYRIVRPVISVLFKICYRPTIVGKEFIPKTGRIVLAGNHTNNFDCLLLISSTKRTIHFLAKDSLMKGIKKIIFKGMAIIPVNRSRKDPEALKNAIDVLNKEQVIGIFPEGTINRTENITLPFKYGAVKMASVTDSVIVPFVITGKYHLFRRKIRIEFLNPYKVGTDLEEEKKKLREIISYHLRRTRRHYELIR